MIAGQLRAKENRSKVLFLMEIFPQVLISGSSGLVGRALVDQFRREGVPHATLVRHSARLGSAAYLWDPYRFEFREEMRQLSGLRAAVHLSGESVSKGRWTAAKMQHLRESRVRTTMSLVELLGRLDRPPEVLICASATGYYGDRGEEVLEETSGSGDGFLAKICREWESAADAAGRFGIRVVHLRFGVILAAHGGALRKMLPLFRRGLGGTLGSGLQWMSWISLPDVVRVIEFCINRSELRGPVNVVANPVTNAEFTVSLAAHLHRPAILPAPTFALRLAFGKIADAALLASTRAIPAALLRSGFAFEHPTLQDALQGILPN
ncbi:MAG: TIGR01777 family oxidoreductase [Acidobacteriaceae bacterium]